MSLMVQGTGTNAADFWGSWKISKWRPELADWFKHMWPMLARDRRPRGVKFLWLYQLPLQAAALELSLIASVELGVPAPFSSRFYTERLRFYIERRQDLPGEISAEREHFFQNATDSWQIGSNVFQNGTDSGQNRGHFFQNGADAVQNGAFLSEQDLSFANYWHFVPEQGRFV